MSIRCSGGEGMMTSGLKINPESSRTVRSDSRIQETSTICGLFRYSLISDFRAIDKACQAFFLRATGGVQASEPARQGKPAEKNRITSDQAAEKRAYFGVGLMPTGGRTLPEACPLFCRPAKGATRPKPAGRTSDRADSAIST